MLASELGRSIHLRFQRPSTWISILGFELIWVPARLLSGIPYDGLGPWEFFVPAMFLAAHLALAALPWQWTGDSRPSAPVWRGLLQAIPWNAAWVFLLVWALAEVVHLGRPADVPGPAPRGQRTDPPWPGDGPRPRPRPGEGLRPLRPAEASAQPLEELRRPLSPRPEMMLMSLNLPFALVLGWFLSEKERAERTEAEAAERERQARARALQSQLHPHVLFNVLGGLTELVREDPDAAEEALVGLTELLRMLMKHGAAQALPLGQERALLRRYLEIEAIRLGPRLQVQWTWQDDLDAIPLPPLLLQPLVENAVKHGISPNPEGGVLRIDAVRTGTGLLLRVANTGASWVEQSSGGTGLANLRERLALLPEPRPTFDLRREGGWTVAELRLEGTFGP